ncbi:MAG TPA: AAA family ATPase [Micromonosporaceae bacterium]
MAQWPFVGRNAEVDEIARTVRASRSGGVLISGPAGVGKTRVALEVAKAVATRSVVHIVRATRTAGTIPLGAVAHLLPAVGIPAHANPIRWAADAIAPRDAAKPVLVIDDAHALDETTAAVVHLLVHAQRARVLATVRTGEDAPDSIVALWKDELVTRTDLSPFDLTGTTELLTAALGGPVARDTCERLHRVADGNALLLHEIVTAAREGGALDAAGGVWWLSKDIPMSPRLTEVIEARLGSLSNGEREAMEYVAFAEPIGVALLERLTPTDVVEAIEARGLIRIGSDGQRLEADLAHPLFGELIRAHCGEARRRRILSALVAVTTSTGSKRRDDALRVAVWAIDCHTPVDPELLLTGARIAWSRLDQELAIRLGRAAARDGNVEAVLFLVEVLDSVQEFEEIATHLDAVARQDFDEPTRTRLAVARINLLAWGRGQHAEALELAEAVLGDIVEPVHRNQIELAAIEINYSRGNWNQAVAQLRNLIATSVSVSVTNEARTILSNALVSIGRLQEAIETVNQVLGDRLSWAEDIPELGGRACVNAVLASQTIGSVDAFDAAVDRFEVEVANNETFANSILVSRGVGAVLRGRMATAVALLRESETARVNGINSLSGMAELARALAHIGDVDGARSAIGISSERTYLMRAEKVPFAVRLNAPWILAAEGRISEAIDAGTEAAAFFRTAGTPRRELVALHDVVRLGGADRVVDRLVELAAGYDGTFAVVCAEHARAAAARDGDALARAAEDFERLGRLLYASEAYAQAAAAHGVHDQVRLARDAAARARTLASHCEGARTPAIAKLEVPDLTAREYEIALMASRGMTSPAIAAALVLAVRTVDNHLRSVYLKLNITGRHDLGQALG